MLAQSLSANPSLLNTTTGKAADVMDTLIQHRIRHGGMEERARKLKEGDEVRASFDRAKAVSSGVMVSNGVYNLDHPELLGFLIQKKANDEQEVFRKHRKKRSDLQERISKISCIRKRKGYGERDSFISWNNDEMKTYLQYKKVKTDTAMPKKEADIRARIATIMHRASPSCSPHQSDNEEEATDGTTSGTTTETTGGIASILEAAMVTNDWNNNQQVDGVLLKARI